MISKDAKARYLKDGGNHCPFCGSVNVESGPINYSDTLSATVTCSYCYKTWTDIYRLTDVEECGPDDS